MKHIIEESANERLLIIYFFQLYARKKEEIDLEFNEEKLKKIIAFKSKNEMVSKELFQCLANDRRWGRWRPVEEVLPKKFYYFNDSENTSNNIDNHPILYTSIKQLNGICFYEAEIGFDLGCDLLDENLNILKFISPNLYDNGFYNIYIYSNKKTLIVVYYYDENNGSGYSYFIYENKELSEIWLTLEKELFFDLVEIEMEDDEFFHLFKMLDGELMADKEVVIAAVSAKGIVLELVSEELKADKEVVLTAVTTSGHALEYASEELKDDKEVVFEAVFSHPGAVEFASEGLKKELNKKTDEIPNGYFTDEERLPF